MSEDKTQTISYIYIYTHCLYFGQCMKALWLNTTATVEPLRRGKIAKKMHLSDDAAWLGDEWSPIETDLCGTGMPIHCNANTINVKQFVLGDTLTQFSIFTFQSIDWWIHSVVLIGGIAIRMIHNLLLRCLIFWSRFQTSAALKFDRYPDLFVWTLNFPISFVDAFDIRVYVSVYLKEENVFNLSVDINIAIFPLENRWTPLRCFVLFSLKDRRRASGPNRCSPSSQ